jgi:hypothetical protein
MHTLRMPSSPANPSNLHAFFGDHCQVLPLCAAPEELLPVLAAASSAQALPALAHHLGSANFIGPTTLCNVCTDLSWHHFVGGLAKCVGVERSVGRCAILQRPSGNPRALQKDRRQKEKSTQSLLGLQRHIDTDAPAKSTRDRKGPWYQPVNYSEYRRSSKRRNPLRQETNLQWPATLVCWILYYMRADFPSSDQCSTLMRCVLACQRQIIVNNISICMVPECAMIVLRRQG